MSAGNLSDEQLLKRAGHAGRNLSVLALLASVGAAALWAVVFLAPQGPFFATVPAIACSLIAAGYWILAVAGRRGNPQSLAVVMVILVLQLVLTLLSAGIAAARTGTDFSSSFNPIRLGIPILVLIALAGSRGVLMELQERGLWEQAFASSKPSRSLCIAGGTLLALGFICFNAGMGYLGSKVQKVQASQRQEAAAFLQIVQVEEKELMTAASAVFKENNRQNLELALNKAVKLENRLATLRAEVQSAELQTVLVTYGNAVRQWKNGLLILKEPAPDTQRARQMLVLGDKFRAEAAKEFDRKFVSKAAQAGQ
jgi:hypothetical protein